MKSCFSLSVLTNPNSLNYLFDNFQIDKENIFGLYVQRKSILGEFSSLYCCGDGASLSTKLER